MVTGGDALMKGVAGKVCRNGSKAVVEIAIPVGPHTRDYVDIPAHKKWTIDLDHSSPLCTAGTFSGGWEGRFAGSQGLFAAIVQNSKPVGTEMLNEVATNVMEADFQRNKAKYWVD